MNDQNTNIETTMFEINNSKEVPDHILKKREMSRAYYNKNKERINRQSSIRRKISRLEKKLEKNQLTDLTSLKKDLTNSYKTSIFPKKERVIFSFFGFKLIKI